MAILFCHLFFCIKKSELVAFFFGGYFPTAPLGFIYKHEHFALTSLSLVEFLANNTGRYSGLRIIIFTFLPNSPLNQWINK